MIDQHRSNEHQLIEPTTTDLGLGRLIWVLWREGVAAMRGLVGGDLLSPPIERTKPLLLHIKFASRRSASSALSLSLSSLHDVVPPPGLYWEGNRVADVLVNLGLQLEIGMHIFDSPPHEVVNVLLEDWRGVSCTSLCPATAIS
ncbi:hypothetical protein QYF36_026695 [Acer negundo]|nr:hypothetical protein QYF36_026695 [Acer negundo]